MNCVLNSLTSSLEPSKTASKESLNDLSSASLEFESTLDLLRSNNPTPTPFAVSIIWISLYRTNFVVEISNRGRDIVSLVCTLDSSYFLIFLKFRYAWVIICAPFYFFYVQIVSPYDSFFKIVPFSCSVRAYSRFAVHNKTKTDLQNVGVKISHLNLMLIGRSRMI